jgi:asparagine synthase (glutamine-hydrolysing)
MVALGHNRLSIIDLSEAGRQPMSDSQGRYWVVFNGEIYNYIELRDELSSQYTFRTRTDTEVLLAAYQTWGDACVERLLGMFAFLIWDERERRLFAARDRFGVKPLYYHQKPDGALALASEIKALHAAGVSANIDAVSWATYLTSGAHDHTERTFWEKIQPLPPGHTLTWQAGKKTISQWYDLAERVGPEWDDRPAEVVKEEYLALLNDSVRLRFRADVAVGVNLSGGLDSSTLLGLVGAVQGKESDVKAYTFVTGDPRYDELPWVRKMLARTHHPLIVCRLDANDVPGLAQSVQAYQDEPFGGIPTLAYAHLFEQARATGSIVVLDGQGMDEQWAGYDYYLLGGNNGRTNFIQGTKEAAVRPECLKPELRALAEGFCAAEPFPDSLRNLQYRDIRYSKIPRALRFNDRVSMRASVELREPFLDHRLVELALRQPRDRKIKEGVRKRLLRKIAQDLLPDGVVEAPKRPLQTPQREWLRGPLREWARECIEEVLTCYSGSWLDAASVRRSWDAYQRGESDNSFYVWQWISLGLVTVHRERLRAAPELSAVDHLSWSAVDRRGGKEKRGEKWVFGG